MMVRCRSSGGSTAEVRVEVVVGHDDEVADEGHAGVQQVVQGAVAQHDALHLALPEEHAQEEVLQREEQVRVGGDAPQDQQPAPVGPQGLQRRLVGHLGDQVGARELLGQGGDVLGIGGEQQLRDGHRRLGQVGGVQSGERGEPPQDPALRGAAAEEDPLLGEGVGQDGRGHVGQRAAVRRGAEEQVGEGQVGHGRTPIVAVQATAWIIAPDGAPSALCRGEARAGRWGRSDGREKSQVETAR